jgi:hypothetical protein
VIENELSNSRSLSDAHLHRLRVREEEEEEEERKTRSHLLACSNAFTMGLLGGALWHFGKGVRNSPKGSTAWTRTHAHALTLTRRRLNAVYVSVCCAGTQSGITIAKTRALRTAGSFGAWGAMFATSEFFILMAR